MIVGTAIIAKPGIFLQQSTLDCLLSLNLTQNWRKKGATGQRWALLYLGDKVSPPYLFPVY